MRKCWNARRRVFRRSAWSEFREGTDVQHLPSPEAAVIIRLFNDHGKRLRALARDDYEVRAFRPLRPEVDI